MAAVILADDIISTAPTYVAHTCLRLIRLFARRPRSFLRVISLSPFRFVECVSLGTVPVLGVPTWSICFSQNPVRANVGYVGWSVFIKTTPTPHVSYVIGHVVDYSPTTSGRW